MSSVPGSGHNIPIREWLDVLVALIEKLRGLEKEIIKDALRLIQTHPSLRWIDMELAEKLWKLENHPAVDNVDRHALARAQAFARGDVS